MIFCVEDDENIRDLIVYTLENTGFQAQGFEDGKCFRAALGHEKPDLVLMDVMLPGEDGVSLLKDLRANSETEAIPVIMVTAKGAEFDKVKALDLGADDYVTKPFGMMELVSRIKAVLRRSGTGNDAGILTLPKQRGSQWTLAVAMDKDFIRCGHVEIVGAGPGDPELVSVRGKRFLQHADLILYAGSLVPRELTHYAKEGAMVRSSASMNLEEQCELMKKYTDRGKLVVRLHTGDPCIFGAIQEQMSFLEANGISYHITPGISSFLAAAAELRSQFTIPERCQTIILTRGEGRTPMPEREKLHLLARSRSTMCIFLSAALVDDVQAQLLQEYPPKTPVAVCHHLTWRDQKIWRGQLSHLVNLVKDNNLTLTTMIVVGEAVGNITPLSPLHSHRSKLYDKNFTHLYRQGEE